MLQVQTHGDAPTFRFHPHAYDLGALEAVNGTSAACGTHRSLRYTHGVYAIESPDYICAWCVADGTAARVFDAQFTDYAGIDGIPHDPNGPVTVDEVEALEVATRTPSYPSWQLQEWRSHCGRPCAFLGDIGASDLAEYLNEPDFLADVNSGLGWDPALIRRHLSRGGDLAGYLFECPSCGANRLHVDAS